MFNKLWIYREASEENGLAQEMCKVWKCVKEIFVVLELGCEKMYYAWNEARSDAGFILGCWSGGKWQWRRWKRWQLIEMHWGHCDSGGKDDDWLKCIKDTVRWRSNEMTLVQMNMSRFWRDGDDWWCMWWNIKSFCLLIAKPNRPMKYTPAEMKATAWTNCYSPREAWKPTELSKSLHSTMLPLW